jgi:dienelactone hydrolase
MWRSILISAVAAAGLLAGGAVAQEPSGKADGDAEERVAAPAKTGYFKTTFDEPHPSGTIKEQKKRFKWSQKQIDANDPKKGVVDWSKQPFVMYVPPKYDPKVAHGLLVYVSATDEAQIHQAWLPVLASQQTIAVAFANAGNTQLLWYRNAYALAAVHNAVKRYTIDPKRITICGYSGGGIVSSRLALHYPDVFTGCFPQCGVTYFRDIRMSADPKRVWVKRCLKPRGAAWKKTRHDVRWVLFTGEQDFNQPNIKDRYEQGFKKDGFKDVHYLEQPGHGHVWCGAEWFAKGMAILDKGRRPGKADAPGGG